MIVYLTSENNLGLFDFLVEEKQMYIKKISGTIPFSLELFIKSDMRNLGGFRYLILDLSIIEEKNNNLIENLISLKTLFDIRVILFAENIEGETLNGILEEAKIANIITSNRIEKIKKEMEICISPNGMDKNYLLKNFNINYNFKIDNQIKYTFPKANTKITIAGVMNRIGTTTTAINIATYLSSLGAKVSYTEGGNSNHLALIHSYYLLNNPVKNNYFTYGGVDYFFRRQVPNSFYDFHIIDIGGINIKNIKIFNLGDIKILCGGVKPNEIEEYKLLLDNIEIEGQYDFLVPKGDIIDINNELPGNKLRSLYKTEYTSSYFDGTTNSKIYREIFTDFTIENQKEIA